MRGAGCYVLGCSKRAAPYKHDVSNERSDSEGESDEESLVKRLFPRFFHR